MVEAPTNEVLFTGRMESRASLTMSLDRLDSFPENLKLKSPIPFTDGTLSRWTWLRP